MSLINGLRWIGCASILTLLLEGCVFFSPVEDMASRAAEMQGWQWTDDAGRPVRLSDFGGKIVVLSMFYQGCAGVCPLTLSRMQVLERSFEERGISARFVLVTLDPRHDNPRRLSTYRARHGLIPDRWSLLTGPSEQTLALSRVLGVHRIDDTSHIVHIGKIVMISADGRRMHALEGRQVNDAIDFATRDSGQH